MDPESKLDAVRNVGIRAGKIAAVRATPLAGKQTIDATGLVVSPGFIDLHAHGQDNENHRYQARDGVIPLPGVMSRKKQVAPKVLAAL